MADFDYSGALQGALNLLSSSTQPVSTDIDQNFLKPGAIDNPDIARYAALGGMMAPTKSGLFSESIANSYNSQADALMKQAQLRAQYLPAVAQAVTARRLAQAQIQNQNAEAAKNQLGAIQMVRQQQMIEPYLQAMFGGQQPPPQGALAAVSSQGDSPATTAYPSLYPQGKNIGPTVNAANLAARAQPPSASPVLGGVMPQAAAMDYLFNGGKDIGGWINDRTKPTPDMINSVYAANGDDALARQTLLMKMQKEGWVTMRNGMLFNPATQQFMAPPPDLVQQQAAAGERGKSLGNTVTQVQPDGSKRTVVLGDVYGSAAPASSPGSSLPAPARNNNPGALMPGGRLAAFASPEEGIAALDGNLQSYGRQGVNTLADVISKWAPPQDANGHQLNNTQAYIADVSQRTGIKPDQTIDLSNPYVRHIIGSAIMVHENGLGGLTQVGGSSTAQPTASPVGVLTEAPPGDVTLRDQGSKMYGQITNEAQSVGQDRNLLAEMAKLASNPNVKFGPGTEGAAKFKAYIQNAPGFSLLPNSAQKDVLSAQTAQDVLRKLASNMAMGRLGQGGQTGTDSQLETLLNSFPHGEMTNDAIKQVLPMLSRQVDARETRLSAANNFLKSRGNDMKSMQDFNEAWSKYGDPVAIEFGRQLAIAQARGDKAAQAQIAQAINSRPDKVDIKAKLQGLNQIGAF